MKVKPFWKQKTFWFGVAIIVSAIAKAYGYTIPNEVFVALFGAQVWAVRDGVKK